MLNTIDATNNSEPIEGMLQCRGEGGGGGSFEGNNFRFLTNDRWKQWPNSQ